MPIQTTFAREALRGAGRNVKFLTSRDPSEPANEEQMRHWWLSGDAERIDDRWIIEENGEQIGYAYFGHPDWAKSPARGARLVAWFGRDAQRPERVGRAFDLLEPYAIKDGTRILMAGSVEGFDDEYAALVARGYKEERRSKSWELDLAAKRDKIAAMTAASRARMADEHIEITTIDRVADPDKWRKLHEMSEASIQDIPTTVPHAPESFESFMKWMSSPGLHADRLWVAREGQAIVGMSVLEYPPGVGNVWTDFTGTSRGVRGRGIARALKLETVTQAIALGVARVRTNNDGENKPILHLNEEMGYTRIPGQIQLHKKVVEGAPA